jgi:hypothetical protein
VSHTEGSGLKARGSGSGLGLAQVDNLVWSLDSDFLRMGRLGFVAWYEPA